MVWLCYWCKCDVDVLGEQLYKQLCSHKSHSRSHSRLMLQKLEISAGQMDNLARMQTLPLPINFQLNRKLPLFTHV